ncbi:MAG TPA: hypothetical protein VF919_03235 [Gemmatimonadales bacterium]
MRYVLTLLLFASGPRVAAQTLGLPLSYRPIARGVGAALDVGGNDAGVRTIAATGVVALGHVTIDSARLSLIDVSASVASLFGPHGAGTSQGALVSLLGSFGVGIERSKWAGATRTYVPLAAALPLLGCSDSKMLFEVYGVPLWNFERVDGATGSSWVPSWGSFTLGVLLESRSGLGLQLGIGGLAQRTTSDPYRRFVIGAGLHFSPHPIVKAVEPSASHRRRRCSFIFGGEG